MYWNVLESLWGLGDVSFCSKVGVCIKCDVMVGKSRRAERTARPSACVWSEPVYDRKRVYT